MSRKIHKAGNSPWNCLVSLLLLKKDRFLFNLLPSYWGITLTLANITSWDNAIVLFQLFSINCKAWWERPGFPLTYKPVGSNVCSTTSTFNFNCENVILACTTKKLMCVVDENLYLYLFKEAEKFLPDILDRKLWSNRILFTALWI